MVSIMPRPQIAILTALLSLGCAPTLVDARGAVNAVSALYKSTKDPLEKQYEDEQIACLEQRRAAPEPCVDAVRAAWKPVRLAEEAFYRAVLLAQSVVGTAEAAAAIGRKPSVMQVMVIISGAVDAGERLRDAVEALHRAPEHPPAVPLAPSPPPAPAPRPAPTAPVKPIEDDIS